MAFIKKLTKLTLLASLLLMITAACQAEPEAAISPTAPSPTRTAEPETAASPTTPSPTLTAVPATPRETEVKPPEKTSNETAIVAYIKDGDIQLWNEANGQKNTIFKGGDVIAVLMSEDGREIAFLRRSIVEDPNLDYLWYEQSALWVVDRNGENAREIVTADALRQLIDTDESESSDIAQIEWVPESQQLVFTGIKYIVQAEGQSHALPSGLFLVDTQTGVTSTLAEPGRNLRFVLALDGRQIALMSLTGSGFLDIDGRNPHQDVFTYPQVGVPGPIFPTGIWTSDSAAFLLVAPNETDSPFILDYTIWRLPLDGTPAEPLTTAINDSHSRSFTFSPDGRLAGYIQGAGQYFIKSLTPMPGPLAVDYRIDEVFWANLNWSPAGNAYFIDGEELVSLCPDAGNDSDICGDPLSLGGAVHAFQWLNPDRFLFMSREPYALYQGKLDGTITPIVSWASTEWPDSRSFTSARDGTAPPTPEPADPPPTPTTTSPSLWLSAVSAVPIYDGPSEINIPVGTLQAGQAIRVSGEYQDTWFPVDCPEGLDGPCRVYWDYNALYSYEAVEPLRLTIPDPAGLAIESTSTTLSPDGRWQVNTIRTETVTLAGDLAPFFYVKMSVDSTVDDASWELVEEWHAAGLGEEGAPSIFHWSADSRYLYFISTFDYHGVHCALYINVGDFLYRLDLNDGTVAQSNPSQVWGLLAISPDERWMAIGSGEGLTVRDMAAAFVNNTGDPDQVVWHIPFERIGPDPISRVSWTADSSTVLVETTEMSDDCQVIGTTSWELDIASGAFTPASP